MGLNDCPYLNHIRLNNILLHRSKPFIKKVITKNIILRPFKNCSKTLGLSQLVSTRVSIKVYRYHQNEPRQGRRYRGDQCHPGPQCSSLLQNQDEHTRKPYNTKTFSSWYLSMTTNVPLNTDDPPIPQHVQSLREMWCPSNHEATVVIRFSLLPSKKLTRDMLQ